MGYRTETSGEDILLLGPFAHRQVITQAELSIAIIATQRFVFVRPCLM